MVESAAHRLLPVDPTRSTTVDGRQHRTERPVTDLAPGIVTLDVIFEPPPGQQLDDSFGLPTRLVVSASPPSLLIDGTGDGPDLRRTLNLNAGEGVLQVVAQAATCDAEAEHAACHLTRQDWGVPVRVVDGGATRIPLVLRGLDT